MLNPVTTKLHREKRTRGSRKKRSQISIHFQRRPSAGGNECVVFFISFSIFSCEHQLGTPKKLTPQKKKHTPNVHVHGEIFTALRAHARSRRRWRLRCARAERISLLACRQHDSFIMHSWWTTLSSKLIYIEHYEY